MTPPSQPLFLASDISSQNKTAAVSLNPPANKVSKKVKKFLRAVSDCDIQMVSVIALQVLAVCVTEG